ncbi:retrovirus-related pol polyprotein from transposon TNT 1-94 [Tanacetum coccineum]
MEQLMIWRCLDEIRGRFRDCFQVLGTCGELDAFVSIPDEGDVAFLRKKVKSGAAVGKLVLLQVFVKSKLRTWSLAQRGERGYAVIRIGEFTEVDRYGFKGVARPFLPEKWLSFSQGLRNANHTQTLDLADIYGRIFKKILMMRLMREPVILQEIAFLKRLNHLINLLSSSMSRGFQTKFTPKFIQSTQHAQSSQGEPKVQKDYKAKYKKMKAKLALLEACPLTSQSSKPFQSKNKGLVAKTFDWDEEEVSDDEEETKVQVLMALADDELCVEKNHARNGEWIDITMKMIPNQKKKILGGEQLTDSSSKNDAKDNPFVPAFLDYDHEMVSKSKDWVKKLNPDSKLPNFNTGRILILNTKAKPYPPCTHCGFNDHYPDDCRNYPECEICGSYDHFTSEHNCVIQIRGEVLAESSQSSESSIGLSCTTYGSSVHSTTNHNDFKHFKRGEKLHATKAKETTKNGCSRSMTDVKSYLHKYVKQSGPKVVFGDNSSCITKGYGSINYGGIVFSKQGTIFNANKEIMLISPKRNDVYVLDMSSLTPSGARFFAKASESEDDPSRQYQSNYDISYYIIPHGRSLTELIKQNQIPEVIAPNKQDNLHTKGVEDTNLASTSSYLVAQDRWSRDQHIELVNIIGDPGKGMLTRSMAAKLITASASECLFPDFLSKIEPKKVFKNKKDEHGIITMNKARLVAQGYSQEDGIDYDETFTLVAKMEAIRIFLAFATYMNFIVFQMDVKSAFLNGKLKEEVYVKQPPGFESSEFPYYVCKLDKALYD